MVRTDTLFLNLPCKSLDLSRRRRLFTSLAFSDKSDVISDAQIEGVNYSDFEQWVFEECPHGRENPAPCC